MKKRFRQAILFIWGVIFWLVLPSCSSKEDIAANKLYQEAVYKVQNINKTAKNYNDALVLYNFANDDIKDIFAKYPSSDIASDLRSGDEQISNLSLEKFKSIRKQIELLAAAENNVFDAALVVSLTIDDPERRTYFLLEVFDLCLRKGANDHAFKTLKYLTDSTMLVDNKKYKAEFLVKISDNYLSLNKFEEALFALVEAEKAIDSVWRDYFKAEIYASIAENYIELKDINKAFELLELALIKIDIIHYDTYKLSVLEKILKAYLSAGEKQIPAQILSKLIQNIKGSNDKKLTNISTMAGSLGMPEISKSAANKIDVSYAETMFSKYERGMVNLLLDSAQIQAQSGNNDRANLLLMKAYEALCLDDYFKNAKVSTQSQLVPTLHYALDRIQHLLSIADWYDYLGNRNKAYKILDISQQILNSSDKKLRISYTKDVAYKYVELDGFEQAINLANSMNLASDTSKILEKVTVRYAELGKVPKGLNLIQSVSYNREGLLLSFVETYSKAYPELKEERLMHSVLAEVKVNLKGILKYDALRDIASGYINAGEFEKAKPVLLDILEITNHFDNYGDRKIKALIGLAKKLNTIGEKNQAKRVLSSVFEMTEEVENIYRKIRIMVRISNELIVADDSGNAYDILEKVKKSVALIDNEKSKLFKINLFSAVASLMPNFEEDKTGIYAYSDALMLILSLEDHEKESAITKVLGYYLSDKQNLLGESNSDLKRFVMEAFPLKSIFATSL